MQISVEKFLNENKHLSKLNDVNTNIELKTSEISRLGLGVYSKFKYFSQGRVQLIGDQEHDMIEKLNKNEIEELFKNDIPILIFARGQKPSDEFIQVGTKNNVLICQSNQPTSKVFSKTYLFLERFLAPKIKIHGVMMSIYGKGVLIKGASGIGKSEVALELIKRGHTLISDDLVILKKLDEYTLATEAPEITKNKMEIRGIGIVDIPKLFGVTSVMLSEKLDLIVEFVSTNDNVERIGNNYKYEDILGVKKKKISIPILSGKNIANIMEVAVANYQLEEDYDYNSAEEFVELVNSTLINKGKASHEYN